MIKCCRMINSSRKLEELAKTLREKRRQYIEQLCNKSLMLNSEYKLVFFKYPYELFDELILSTKWLFNGFLIYLGKVIILVDPGAEILTRIPDLKDLLKVNTLYISHGHIDHYADANIAIEFMVLPKQKEIKLLAPKDVFKRKLISDYHSGRDGKLTQIRILELNKKLKIKLNGVILRPIALYHSLEENFGFILEYEKLKIGYLADTGYTHTFKTSTGKIYPSGTNNHEGNFEDIISKNKRIKNIFSQVDILIANINDLIFTKHSKYHLTGYDLIDILSDSQVKKCFISNLHPIDLLGLNIAKKISSFITKKSGVETIFIPKSGLSFDLSRTI